MGLKEKLLSMKDTITDTVEEFADTTELSAEEYAKYYGASYTNFLNYIKKQMYNQMAEEYNEGRAKTIDEVELNIVLPIGSIKEKDIIFANDEFGTKEKFNLTILKNLLYRARISYAISDDLSSMTLTKDNTPRMSDRINKLAESKDTYIGLVKNIVSASNMYARSQAKSLLRDLSDWADKKL